MSNPYQKYKEDSILTMTPSEILILLYDELLKRIKASELFLEKENFDEFEKNITKAQEIIDYLRQTLDFNYSISQELYRMYDFFIVQINRVKVSRNKEHIQSLYPLVQDLRDAFSLASKKENK